MSPDVMNSTADQIDYVYIRKLASEIFAYATCLMIINV